MSQQKRLHSKARKAKLTSGREKVREDQLVCLLVRGVVAKEHGGLRALPPLDQPEPPDKHVLSRALDSLTSCLYSQKIHQNPTKSPPKDQATLLLFSFCNCSTHLIPWPRQEDMKSSPEDRTVRHDFQRNKSMAIQARSVKLS